MYTGVLPYSINEKGNVIFLIGKEKYKSGWNGSEKWSDFGGLAHGDNILKNAAREFYEETMGLLGTENKIIKLLKKSKRVEVDGGYIYLLYIEYMKNIPEMFNNFSQYVEKCIIYCPEGFFEKTEIRWITESKLKRDFIKYNHMYRKKFQLSMKNIIIRLRHKL